MSDLSGNEVTIAIIGLAGVLVTAFLSNWEKMFPKKNEVKVTFSGYHQSNDFETELRYYFLISGARKMLENMTLQLSINQRASLIQEYPEDADGINKIMDASLEEAITVDDVIKNLLPVYKNYFSIEELQEMNKFYSTEIMQNMVKKMPGLTIEAAPVQVELINDFQSRLNTRIRTILIEKDGNLET
jgi:hypothetical protein